MENSNQMEYFKYGWKCFQMDEKWKIKKKKKLNRFKLVPNLSITFKKKFEK